MLNFLNEIRAEECPTVYFRETILNLDEEKEWLSKKDGLKEILYVIEVDGRIIASIGATISKVAERSHICEFGMTVLKEFRNQGIGRKLIQKLLEWTENRDVLIVELYVFSINTHAIHLYSDLGFLEDGRVKNGIKLRNGEYCDLIHMSRYTEGQQVAGGDRPR